MKSKINSKKAWEQLFATLDKVEGPKPTNRKAAKAAEEKLVAIVKASRKQSRG